MDNFDRLGQMLYDIGASSALKRGQFREFVTDGYGIDPSPAPLPWMAAFPSGIDLIITKSMPPRDAGLYCIPEKFVVLYGGADPAVWVHELAHVIDHKINGADFFPDYPRCELVACKVQLWAFEQLSLSDSPIMSVAHIRQYAAYHTAKAKAEIGLDTDDRNVNRRVERIQKYILERTLTSEKRVIYCGA